MLFVVKEKGTDPVIGAGLMAAFLSALVALCFLCPHVSQQRLRVSFGTSKGYQADAVVLKSSVYPQPGKTFPNTAAALNSCPQDLFLILTNATYN